jgi:steroid 5-alpha reductase family enzyme
VTTELLLRVGQAWVLAAGIQLVLWLVQQKTKNAGIVDVGWALAFTPVAALFAWRSTSCACGWGVIAAIVVAWSVRLGAYLVARGAASPPEEGRYKDLRARWGDSATGKFFVFFQFQAALVGILSSAFAVPFIVEPRAGSWWIRALGATVSIVGILGEATSDLQLSRFKRDAANKGKVCDVGLWGWSRHPNYFFEWCVWIGYAVYGLAFGWLGLVAIVGQAIIVGSIFGVTGIPPTEKQAIRSKGDAYRDYQKRVSRFIPLPPKQRSHGA